MADRTTLEARPPKVAKAPKKIAVTSEERERIFDAFRRWGYFEADLDPLKLFKPLKYPDLELTGAAADEARRDLLRDDRGRVYASAGARAAEVDCRAAGGSLRRKSIRTKFSSGWCARICLSRFCRRAIWERSDFRWKA